LEAHYGLSPDWVVWAGGSQSQLYSRSLATLPSSSINLISGTLLENSEPAIKDTRVVWRGRDPGSGRIEVYYKDLLSGASPIRVSDNTVFESEFPRLSFVTAEAAGVPGLSTWGLVVMGVVFLGAIG